MVNDKVHANFKKAVAFANEYAVPLPADILLKLYAYYKIANQNQDHPGSRTPLINAFKANALIQARNMSREQAMKEYTKLVKKELKNK